MYTVYDTVVIATTTGEFEGDNACIETTVADDELVLENAGEAVIEKVAELVLDDVELAVSDAQVVREQSEFEIS
jgi:hypothetical protein